MALKEDIKKIRKLSPEDRIKELKRLKKQIEEDKKKEEKEIDNLTKESQQEIIRKEEEKEISELLKAHDYRGILEETIEKEKISKEAEDKASQQIQYGESINQIKDIREELYSLQGTEDWGYEENKRLEKAEKQLDEIQQYRNVMSKYAADQVNTSQKVLKALKMYKGY